MLGRVLLTLDALGLVFGAWLADYFSESHMFNPLWTPHAKFHCGMTISLSTALGLATLFLTWRPALVRGTSREIARDSLRTAAFTGSVYWLAGLAANWFPGTSGLDVEFGGPAFPQRPIFLTFGTLGLLGSWAELVL